MCMLVRCYFRPMIIDKSSLTGAGRRRRREDGLSNMNQRENLWNVMEKLSTLKKKKKRLGCDTESHQNELCVKNK